MDCEKFDRVVLDLLYDELDELTAAAARRHMEHCARCGPIGSGLRATREVGVVPQLDPPEPLFSRILESERNAHAALTLRQRIGRGISVTAGYAMRPQLAMAAVLLLMIGLSLLLLQFRPAETTLAAAERGVPEIEGEPAASAAMMEAARTLELSSDVFDSRGGPLSPGNRELGAPEATTEMDDADYERAMGDFRAGRFSEAESRFERLARAGGAQAPSAELWAAQSARQARGCGAAAPMLARVAQRRADSSVGHEAAWQAAECFRAEGQSELARRQYTSLLSAPAYAERAGRALEALGGSTPHQVVASRRAAKAAARPAPAALPPVAPGATSSSPALSAPAPADGGPNH